MTVTNRELKNVRQLRTRKGRREQLLCMAEGLRLIEQAFKHGARPQWLYYSSHLLSPAGHRLVEKAERKGIETKSLTASQMRSASDTREPQGLLATFPNPAVSIDELYRPGHRRLLLCENISDPGNLGTLIRSAVAFGFDLLLTCGRTAEVRSPKVIRASAGAVFALTEVRLELKEIVAFITAKKVALVACDVRGNQSRLPDRFRRRKSMLAIGSEAAGLSDEIFSAAEIRIRIKHTNKVESLNAAVAGSIIMSHFFNSFREEQ